MGGVLSAIQMNAAEYASYLTRGIPQPVDVALVGCGCPKRGMGWYHLVQLLEMPEANVTAVVEPWYLGAGKEAPGADKFMEMKADLESRGVAFYASVTDMPAVAAGGKLCVLIAGRTADNPRFFKECIDKGATHIYLEKPGAPTVQELETMKQQASEAGVGVFLGYNKNVTKYVTLAREFEAKTPGAETTFIHNNAYKPEELPECFSRNREGMLKNMAVHELALLVTYYGVSCDNVESVAPIPEDCTLQTLGDFTDFSKVAFTVTTKDGKSVTVKADRCGGSNSIAIVKVDGEEVFSSVTPDDELKARVEEQQKADPEMMPYFFLQSDDYLTLKSRVLKNVATGLPAEGIATIDIAVETIKVAEMFNEQIRAALA
eukprot:scaffold449_cov241-Pinguiococcus_pyrenoidosus.AAC.18